MPKQDMKTEKETEVKHIKKISAQPKTSNGDKPEAKGPGALGGCIPVGN